MNDNIEYLEHVGILGMHWGSRKSEGGTSKPSSKHKIIPSEDHVIAASIKKKKLSEMSNKEIQALATRIDLERRYKALSPTKIKKGKDHFNTAIKVMGAVTLAVTTVAALYGSYQKVKGAYPTITGTIAGAVAKQVLKRSTAADIAFRLARYGAGSTKLTIAEELAARVASL